MNIGRQNIVCNEYTLYSLNTPYIIYIYIYIHKWTYVCKYACMYVCLSVCIFVVARSSSTLSISIFAFAWIFFKDMAHCVRDRTLTALSSMAFLARFLSSFKLSLDDSLSSLKIHGSLRWWQDTHRFVINGLFARFLSSSEVHFCLCKFFFHARWVPCSASSWRSV